MIFTYFSPDPDAVDDNDVYGHVNNVVYAI
jgi:hypothetical protein